jgi:hypothetical protein
MPLSNTDCETVDPAQVAPLKAKPRHSSLATVASPGKTGPSTNICIAKPCMIGGCGSDVYVNRY